MKKIIALVFTMFLLTGCIQFSQYIKANRDGTIDMTFNITSDMWDELLEQGADTEEPEIADELKDKYEFIPLDNGYSMVFTGLDPKTDTTLFKDTDSETPMETDMPILTVEKKSDGTYYTIVIPHDENMSSEEAQMAASMFDYKLYFETFGTIVETNGEKINDRVVMFDFFEVQGDMKVVWKDSGAWYTNIWYILGLFVSIAIIGGAIFLFFRKDDYDPGDMDDKKYLDEK